MRGKALMSNIGLGLLIFSMTFILPIVVALIYKEGIYQIALTYILPMIVTIIIGSTLWVIGRNKSNQLREREAFATAGYLWLIMAFLGSLPYIFSGVLRDPINAYFESMSGFVTCGNTVISDIESVPHSIVFWRSLTQWIGGLGILVLTVMFLSGVFGGALLLFRAEVPGYDKQKIGHKIRDTSKSLWGIYFFLTVVGVILLYLAGMNLFDSINHSMTSLATGGFSTKNSSIGYYESPVIEGVIIVLMILGSTNFILHFNILKGNFRTVIRDQELRYYILILIFFTVVITIDLALQTDYGILNSFRYAIFQTISSNGTVGFVNTDFSPNGPVTWPISSLFLLVIMMIIGASSGSTGGALKIARSVILIKSIKREFLKIQHPRAIVPIRIGTQIIPDPIVMKVALFTFLYILIFFISTGALLFTGLDLPTSTSASASALGNVGSGIGKAAGTYDFIHPIGKVILIICMWLGRLEIYAAANIFFPSTYKK